MKHRRPWKKNFIAALRTMGNVWIAARQACISRRNCYAEYKRNPEFAKQWDAAEQESADRLEAEAWRRAHDGIDKPVYWQGEKVDTVKEYSDTLLTLLLRARRPERFRENYNVAIGNPDGSAIQIDARKQALNLFTTSPEAAAHMIALSNLMIPEEPTVAKKQAKAEEFAASITAETVKTEPFITPEPASASQEPPVASVSKPKAKKTRKAKKTPPQAEEIELDDSDAQPLSGLMAAFLPKSQ